jgi:hypothetical protein
MRALTSIALLCLSGWCAACGRVETGFKGTITIDQSNSPTATKGVACTSNDTNKYVGETSYFRVFRLADHDIEGPFRVTTVSFAVSQRQVGTAATRFPIDVSVHNYTGVVGGETIDNSPAVMPLVKSAMVDILPTPSTTFFLVKYDLPLVAEITEDAFAVRIHVPNYVAQMHKFFLAVSEMGDKVSGYMACGASAPKTLTGLGAPNDSLLIQVTGEAY